MANARQLPSGSWRVQVYAGKNAADKPQYRSFTAPSKKEAEYHPELTLRTPLPQREHKEQKILEPGQIAVLLAAVEGGPMELPVLMGVWLCMRASEIAALTWDCIDFERKTLTTKKALVRSRDGSWVEKTTKTTSPPGRSACRSISWASWRRPGRGPAATGWCPSPGPAYTAG